MFHLLVPTLLHNPPYRTGFQILPFPCYKPSRFGPFIRLITRLLFSGSALNMSRMREANCGAHGNFICDFLFFFGGKKVDSAFCQPLIRQGKWPCYTPSNQPYATVWANWFHTRACIHDLRQKSGKFQVPQKTLFLHESGNMGTISLLVKKLSCCGFRTPVA